MGNVTAQIRELAPSAREPLFRRLMAAEELSYLREKNSIIGFEVDTAAEQSLAGFTLIAIQKHTIYAYCSDLHEAPKLALFPPIDKLFDPAFGLLGLKVTKRRYANSTFSGTDLGYGMLEELVRDLTPPKKQMDISEAVARQMTERMKQQEAAGPVTLQKGPQAPPETPGNAQEGYFEEPMEVDLNAGFEDGYDDFDGYEEPYMDDYGGYEEPYMKEGPAEDARSTKLKAQAFASLPDVTDFCASKLGVPRPLAITLVNAALQSNVDAGQRVALAVKLFCKAFDEGKL